MAVSKLTVVAQLKDELTGPLKRAKQGLNDVAAASDKAAKAGEAEARAFEHLAKSAGWATDKFGKWHHANGQFVSQAARAELAAKAQTKATNDLARAAKREAEAFEQVIRAHGWKIASDGKVRNSMGHFVKAQDVLVAKTIAANNVNMAAKRRTDELASSTNKATQFARLQREEFMAHLKINGYTLNSQGKIINSLGEYASVMEVARFKVAATAAANRRMAIAAEAVGSTTARAADSADMFSRRAFRVGFAVERLARDFGHSEGSARSFGVRSGRAFDQLAVSASRGVAGAKRHLSSLGASLDGTAAKMDSAFKATAKGAGLATAGVAGGALIGGMQRINSLQASDVRMEVQGLSEDQRKTLQGDVNDLVIGTSINLDEGMNLAQSLMGSGIEYGDPLKDRMGLSVDAMALYGGNDPNELATVLGQIQSKGTLYGEELNQLAERKIPIRKWIAEQQGIEQSEVMEKIEAKEITADDMWEALRPNVENGAKKMGETFMGAFRSMRAAFSRSGERFLLPTLETLERGMRDLTKMLDAAEPFFTGLGNMANTALEQFVDLLPEIGRLFEALAPSFTQLFGAAAELIPGLVHGFVNWLEILTPLLIVMMEFTALLLQLVGPILPVLVPLLMGSLILLRGFIIVQKLLTPFKALVGWLGRLYKPLIDAGKAGFLFVKNAGSLTNILKGLWTVVRANPIGILLTALYLAVRAFGWLYENVGWVKDATDTLVAGFEKVEESIRNIGGAIEELIRKWFPALEGPMDRMKTNMEGLKGGAVQEAIDDTGFGGNPIFTYIQKQTGFDHVLENLFPWRRSEEDGGAPDDPNSIDMFTGSDVMSGYATGGWTAPGAHTVGERGTEFITQHWAANKIETNHPGALEHMNATGELPATGGQVVVQAEVNINGAQQPDTIAAQVEAAIRQMARDASREYMTLSAKGAN